MRYNFILFYFLFCEKVDIVQLKWNGLRIKQLNFTQLVWQFPHFQEHVHGMGFVAIL